MSTTDGSTITVARSSLRGLTPNGPLRKSIHINAGILRCIDLVLPEASVVNSRFPAACGMRFTTAMRIHDLCLGLLTQALEGLAPVGGSGTLVVTYISALDSLRRNREADRETLRAHFAHGRNVSATAVALGLARGTVENHLRQVERVIGRPLSPRALQHARLQTNIRPHR